MTEDALERLRSFDTDVTFKRRWWHNFFDFIGRFDAVQKLWKADLKTKKR